MWCHYDNIGRWVSNLEHNPGLFHFTFLSRYSELFIHTWWQWRRRYIGHVSKILHFDCIRTSAGGSRIIPGAVSLGLIGWRIITKCWKSHVSRRLHFIFEYGSEKGLSVVLKRNKKSINISEILVIIRNTLLSQNNYLNLKMTIQKLKQFWIVTDRKRVFFKAVNIVFFDSTYVKLRVKVSSTLCAEVSQGKYGSWWYKKRAA